MKICIRCLIKEIGNSNANDFNSKEVKFKEFQLLSI